MRYCNTCCYTETTFNICVTATLTVLLLLHLIFILLQHTLLYCNYIYVLIETILIKIFYNADKSDQIPVLFISFIIVMDKKFNTFIFLYESI